MLRVHITNRTTGGEYVFLAADTEEMQARLAEHDARPPLSQVYGAASEREVTVEDAAIQERASLLAQISAAYAEVERNNLTPAGAIQLAEWCAAGNQKALAVRAWIVALYAERDAKMAQIEGGSLTVDIQPSSPWKPHTFREMGAS